MKVFIEGCEWKNVESVDIQAVPKWGKPLNKEKDYLVTIYYSVNGEKWFQVLRCEWVKHIPDENGNLTDDLIITGVLEGYGDRID